MRCRYASSWAFGRSAPPVISSSAHRRSPTASTSLPASVRPVSRLRRLSRRRSSTRSWLAAVGPRPRLRGLCFHHRSTYPRPPGEIVCLCRSISRGEIEAACRQPTEPRTLDAIKRRSGATFGDCQGNLCGLDVARIVAAERGIAVSAVEKHRRGSWLWEAGGQSLAAEAWRDPAEMPSSTDVVVIGLGLAGRAAAEAATGAGASVVGRRPARRRDRGRAVARRRRRLGRAGPVHGGQRGDRDGGRDRRHRRVFRAARASFHRGWQAGRGDDR